MRLISRAVVATVIILVIFASEATAQIRVHDDPWSLLPETFCLGGTEIEIVIGVDQVNVVNIVLGCLEIDYPFDWVDVVPVPPAQDQAYPPTTTPPNAPAQDKSRGQGPPSDSHGCGIACSGVGNPINTASLNKYQNEVDFVGPGQLPLRISRHYNSLWADASVNNGRFGQGWSSNLGERLVAIQIPPPNDPNPVYNVLIENETGYRYRITSTDNSKWTTTEGRAVNFKWDEVNETFTLFEDGLTKIFLKSGFLEIVTHSSGETLEYEYKNGTTWGELESIVHSNGSTMTFTYDFALRVKTVTDPGGFVYTYNYDSNNNLASVIHPHVAAYGSAASTGKTTYHYEDSSFPSALTGKSYNVNGFPRRFSTYAYTGSGQATSTGNGNGSINSFTVNTSGNQGYDIQRTITNPNGKFLMYRFDVIADVPRLRDVTTIADATTPATTQLWTYDANGRYDLVTDAEGNVVDYDFGDDGLLASMTSGFGTADARQTTYEWDPVYRKQTKITTPLLTTDIELDGSGEPRKITQTNTSTFGASQAPRIWNIDKTKYSLSSINQQIEIDGPLAGTDDKTTYLFDPSGRLTSIVVAVSANDSLTTTFSNYDAYGRVGTITYPSGLVERYDYHPRGYVLRKRETVGADVRTTNYEYRESGDLRQITRPDGSELLFSYDPYFRLIKTTWADGDSNYNDDIFKTFVYDPANNLTREQAYQRVSSWIDDPNCNPPWWEPEPCSQIQVWADQLTFDRDYDYDSLSRLTEIDYFGSYRKVNYGYNGNGQLDEVIDAYGRSTDVDFDANNQPGSTTYRDGGIANYSYDANGNTSGIQDALGNWTYYRRDGFGQAWEIESPATGTTYLEYDEAGNVSQKTDARNVELVYTYDFLNRLEEVRETGALRQAFTYDDDQPGYLHTAWEGSNTSTYLRNDAGEVTSKKIELNGSSTSFELAYAYDAFGRLSQITYPGGLVAGYTYDSFGRTSRVNVTGAGVSSTNLVLGVAYYPFGPTKRIVFGNYEMRTFNRDTGYQLYQLSSGTNVNNVYGHDNNSNITSFAGRSMTYDNMDRLKTHNGPDGNWSYQYDLNGNREWHKENGQQTTYSYDASKTFLETLSGATTESRLYNQIGSTKDIDGRLFNYDYAGRMTRYIDSAASIDVNYRYTPFGARFFKDDGTTRTYFQYDGANLMHEKTGAVSSDYIYLNGEIVGMVRSGQLYYVHGDHLGRPQYVTNSAKVVKWSSENNAFGSNPGVDLIGGLNIGFPGQYYDVESGTSYNYFRTYDATTGRYLQSDPIGLAGGLNTFSYANGNPVNSVDPLGLFVYGTGPGTSNGNPLILNIGGQNGSQRSVVTGQCLADGTERITVTGELTDTVSATGTGAGLGTGIMSISLGSAERSGFAASVEHLQRMDRALITGNGRVALGELSRHQSAARFAADSKTIRKIIRVGGSAIIVIDVGLAGIDAAEGRAGKSKPILLGAAATASLILAPGVGVFLGALILTLEVGGDTNEMSLMLDEAIVDAVSE